MKLITKTDEQGNTWLLIGKSDTKQVHDFTSVVSLAISTGRLSAKIATASEIAKACDLDASRKPIINAIAKTMRAMGCEERRRGTGKYFVINQADDDLIL